MRISIKRILKSSAWTALIFIVIMGSLLPAGCADAAKPVYIFVMISDGCGFEHIKATDLYQYGEAGKQIYESFPVKYGMSHHPVDGLPYDPVKAWKDFEWVKFRPTDSAASATALATGVKTLNGRISVSMKDEPLETLVQYFESMGLSSGVVTSVPISHATPAAFGAHNLARHNYAEIAREMLTASPLDVIMGCGHPDYDDDGEPVPAEKKDYKYVGGDSTWSRLLAGTLGNDCDGDGSPDTWTFTDERDGLLSWIHEAAPKRAVFIPRVHSTLQERREGDGELPPFATDFLPGIPKLEEMTRAAIHVLDSDPEGFFLMIEGGAIDWASHDNLLGRMIEEEIDFNKSVEAVVEWIENNDAWDRSLVIVTADHETGYLHGPGSGNEIKGKNTRRGVWKPIISRGKGKMPEAVWYSGSHTASLVPFYARGYGAELFKKYINGTDKIRGPYIDHTAISRVLFSMFYQQKGDSF
jgi:alkaline phosphatase